MLNEISLTLPQIPAVRGDVFYEMMFYQSNQNEPVIGKHLK